MEEPLERSAERARSERTPLNPQQIQGFAGQQPPANGSPEQSDASDDFRQYPPARCCGPCFKTIAFAISGSILVLLVAAAVFYYVGLHYGRSEKPGGTVPVAPEAPWLPWRDRTDDVGVPRILLWNRPSSWETGARTQWQWKSPRACSYGSKYSPRRECEVTNDRAFLMKTDAIVFHANHLSRVDLPNWRANLQMWVFWAHAHLPSAGSNGGTQFSLSLPGVASQFNWTMGHRDDADVKVPYKTWTCRYKAGRKPLRETLGKRNATQKPTAVGRGQEPQELLKAASNRLETKKDAAWILADCELNRFEEEARNSRHFQVAEDVPVGNVENPVRLHLFPACGAAQCNSPSGCVRQIAESYHFIIVSMTPECFSTVEELIYDAFEHDVVPVVLAPHDAVLDVPPNSVVSSANLHGPGQLSGFLRSLLDDPAKYESYFAWKRNCTITTPRDDLCPLCESLWEQPLRKGAHPDALKWWTLRSNCQDEPLFGLDSTFEVEV